MDSSGEFKTVFSEDVFSVNFVLFSIFVSFLSETLDSSQFENAMYYVLEPSFQFKDSDDFYYNAYYKTKSYKGKDVKDIGVFSDRSSFLSLLEPL